MCWRNKWEFSPFVQDVCRDPIGVGIGSDSIRFGILSKFIKIRVRTDTLNNEVVLASKYFSPEFNFFYIVFDG